MLALVRLMVLGREVEGETDREQAERVGRQGRAG
jgi:hypothetical protein